jgi:hypothetical protein
MTRKLTDEQVKAINDLFENDKGRINYYALCGNVNKEIDVRVYATQNRTEYCVSAGTDSYEALGMGNFKTADKAIAYAEHLLNQRYCWLPQNNGWIMSGEVYNFANGGANKVLELMHINDHFSWFAYWMEYGIPWFLVYDLEKLERGYPTPEQLSKGITIPADSPIWDAVKGV